MAKIKGEPRIFVRTGPRPPRVYFLDELRGLCVVFMVLYHGIYDIVYLFGRDIPAFHSAAFRIAQPVVAGIFIAISGMCCRFSRSNRKRGLIALGLGLVMSAVTILLVREQAIYFGILHFMGTSMLLFALISPLLDKVTPLPGLLGCLLLFAFFYGASGGTIGLFGLRISLPASWAELPWLIPIGFAGAGADYFPWLPWLFLFLAGSYLGVPFARREMPEFFYRSHAYPLEWVGRRAILIYLLHQPVIYGLLYAYFFLRSRFLL